MEWQVSLVIAFGLLLCFFASGMPVVFGFLSLTFIGLFVLAGGTVGWSLVVTSIFATLSSFVLVPVPLFVLLGALLQYSGIGADAVSAVDNWMGRLPGRLSIVALISGTLLGAVTGVSMATVAILSTTLEPEMRRRGYSRLLTIGPILAAGTLAPLIPPSALAVLLASVAQVSVAQVLIGGIVPGLLLSAFYSAYTVGVAFVRPHLAPQYVPRRVSLLEKISGLKHGLSLGVIIFMVVGLILLGVAAPSEAAALGVLGAFVLMVLYRRFNLDILKNSIAGTAHITSLVLIIYVGSKAFSELLALAGIAGGLVKFVATLDVPPLALVLGMQLVILMLGCFIDVFSIMLITIPIYMPIVKAIGVDPVWFVIISLVTLELGVITPPFGLLLFQAQGAMPDTTTADVYKAVVPYVVVALVGVTLMVAFPSLVTWLPRAVSPR